MNFKDFGFSTRVLRAIEKENYTIPSLIQEQAIPYILDNKDVLGCAQTGTGKTAAFALPIIENLLKLPMDNSIKVLVLTPTRELAVQVRENFRKYAEFTNLRSFAIYGGVNQRSQVQMLNKGIDILVATPGRLLDLINQRHVKLNNVQTLVLDEADTMLDMGFIIDVKKIIAYIPIKRQTLLFSATIPNEIKTLANSLLHEHVTVNVNTESVSVEKINQSVYYIDKINKSKLLLDLLKQEDVISTLIFVRTKNGANKLGDILDRNGIRCGVIHGNKSQGARMTALSQFKTKQSKVLVATDIAARGIDISELSHVINFEVPEKPEVYVHRIGRTGRAGLNGIAISFCDSKEKYLFKSIERLIKKNIDVVMDHNYPMQQLEVAEDNNKPRGNNRNRHSSRGNNRSNFRKNA